jgi:hypothetical protein
MDIATIKERSRRIRAIGEYLPVSELVLARGVPVRADTGVITRSLYAAAG